MLHKVGNKQTGEGYILSPSPLPLDDRMRDVLLQYFIAQFKADEYFHLFHEDGLEHNVVYGAACAVFDDPDALADASRDVAQHLYESSMHPNIKGGDLFVVRFSDCLLNGEPTSALGLFKAESVSQFLKVRIDDEQWSRREGDPGATGLLQLHVDKGIDTHRLDKGALIFDRERSEGFVVSVVDASGRGSDAQYWRDAFLRLQQRQDEYYNTQEVMNAYKAFVTDALPQRFDDVSKADQADLLNRSVQYFKDKDNFDMDDFARDVLQQPEVIDSFASFREEYEQAHEVELPAQFDINETAVKKQARAFKSVIKLDKNFHIYVHGDRQLIEQGEDERGKYYKVYYHEES